MSGFIKGNKRRRHCSREIGPAIAAGSHAVSSWSFTCIKHLPIVVGRFLRGIIISDVYERGSGGGTRLGRINVNALTREAQRRDAPRSGGEQGAEGGEEFAPATESDFFRA
jgi:hypothetical protein